jgi:hypothetical protein
MQILGLDVLKSVMIVLVVLLYWKFVYYKYHKNAITPISYFAIGALLVFIGFYAFFFEGSVTFENVRIIHYIIPAFLIVSFLMVIRGINKHGLDDDVDITLTWTRKTFPFIPFWIWMIIAFPALFFIAIATYAILGPEHIVFWSMIFLAWVASDRRLYQKRIAK